REIRPADSRALVFDFDQQWAQENRPQPGAKWDYRQRLDGEWFGAAYDVWGGIRVSPFATALATASLVLAPHFQMIRPDHYGALEKFLKRGGTFVTTADFGRLDWENNVRPIPPLGGLAPLGVTVPAGEMLHLAPDFTISGKHGAKDLRGKYFWWVPDDGVQTLQPAVTLADGDTVGPAWVDFTVSGGRVRVLTTAFDRASLAEMFRDL
ncbi:MAG: beta-galactosidase trimerization domain-containing protein, partial [Verrucomicrobiales bacterium]|nr:beta-galactosidase trimerization domain-containing protein [Verrucomicrobiales bacterium]